MTTARANGIEIAYETFGTPEGRPLLLIMGLAAQMILWDDDFCAALASRGHRVIRFDNRDVGLSTKCDWAGMPDAAAAMQAAFLGQRVDAPYTLWDMAADAVGLLDALGIAAAHVVGASMGGMIAQAMAIAHPARVLSLTSIMSSTGDRSLPPARPEAAAVLLLPVVAGRAANVERAVHVFRTIGSPGFPFDEPRVRELAARSYDRCFHPAGAARQLVAILASGSRKEALGAVAVPTLVIHGRDDPLIPVEAGLATARAVRGAELLVIDGMGHDLPRAVWPSIVDRISAPAARAGRAGPMRSRTLELDGRARGDDGGGARPGAGGGARPGRACPATVRRGPDGRQGGGPLPLRAAGARRARPALARAPPRSRGAGALDARALLRRCLTRRARGRRGARRPGARAARAHAVGKSGVHGGRPLADRPPRAAVVVRPDGAADHGPDAARPGRPGPSRRTRGVAPARGPAPRLVLRALRGRRPRPAARRARALRRKRRAVARRACARGGQPVTGGGGAPARCQKGGG